MDSRYKFRVVDNRGDEPVVESVTSIDWLNKIVCYTNEYNEEECVPFSECALLQYTGRQACTDELDADGIHQQKQDLYGGDIIRHEVTGVDFSDDCEPLFETHAVRYSDADVAWRCGPYSLQSVLSGSHRLIGNVHEHPELLEEKSHV